MLPEPSLDKEEFEMIMDEARTQIAGLYPEWTDFNYHDPGITLIELFSWLKESRQFYIDQISDETRKKYLKLLGIRLRHRIPSRAVVSVPVREDVTVLNGTRLFAGNVCFEAEKRTLLIGGGITACFSASDRILTLVEEPESRQPLSIELFGAKPKPGNCFYTVFSHALPKGEAFRLYLDLTNRVHAVRIRPLETMAVPLAKLCLQFYSEGNWKAVSQLEDETQGGIFSGFMYFVLPDAMEEAEVFGRRGYYLRLLLTEEEYDVPPIVSRISVNAIPVVQRETLIEAVAIDETEVEERETAFFFQAHTMAALNGKNELYLRFVAENGDTYYRYLERFEKECNFDTGKTRFEFTAYSEAEPNGLLLVSSQEEERKNALLGIGNGFPFQKFDLEDDAIEYDRFSLLIREEDGFYYPWEKREDFSCSGPEDRHYILDAENGTVCFGDCISAMAPEGEIRIISYARTLGQTGNVKSRAIDRFEGLSPEELPVWNEKNSVGGEDEETVDAGFERAKRELRFPDIAVTEQDYERLVMETPGLLLENCKVLKGFEAGDTGIYIVVKPLSEGGSVPGIPVPLSPCCQENILRYLEPHRMAGRKITLLPPEPISFDLYADLVLKPQYVGAAELVQRAVRDYFRQIGGRFGAEVSYSAFYGMLDMLPYVAGIHSLTFDARGNGIRRRKDGSVVLPPSGLAVLGETKYLFTIGE